MTSKLIGELVELRSRLAEANIDTQDLRPMTVTMSEAYEIWKECFPNCMDNPPMPSQEFEFYGVKLFVTEQ